MKYKRIETVVEAFKYGANEVPDWFLDNNLASSYISDKSRSVLKKGGHIDNLRVQTNEGFRYVTRDSYIINCKTKGMYLMTSKDFDKLYVSD